MQAGDDKAGYDFGRVRGVVAGLERAVRSHRLHEGQGPTVEEHLDTATQQLTELLTGGALTLRVSSFGLLYGNRRLSGAREVDPAWFGLFADSVRDLTFQPGVSRRELTTFVEVLCEEPGEGEDRVTLLWRREVHTIQLFVGSLLPARLETGEDGDVRLVTPSGGSPFLVVDEEAPDAPDLAFSNFDPRRLLESGGLSWITRVSSQPFEADPWLEGSPLAAGPRARGEDVLRFVEALGESGDTAPDADSLSPLVDGYLETLLTRVPEPRLLPFLDALVGSTSLALAPLLRALASPASLERLAPHCDHNPEAFEPIVTALGQLDPEGLSALLVHLRSTDAQARFARLAGAAGGDVVPFYIGQLDSIDDREALSAVDALASLDNDRGIEGLALALESSVDRVRYQALRALAGRARPEVIPALVGILGDPRRVHRLLALHMLGDSGDAAAVLGITTRMGQPEFLERDPEEQATWLRSLASLPSAQSVPVLEKLLGERSAARKGIAQLQLLVVEQLGSSDAPRARAILTEMKGRWQLARAVRKAIAAALTDGGAK